MTMTVDNDVRTVPWSAHYNALRWDQGDHLLIAAPTKAGKTTLARQLAEKRSHVAMLVTKTHDETIRHEFKDWARIQSWPPSPWQTHVLVWPKPGKTLDETLAIQRRTMRDALDGIGRGNKGGWSGWGVLVDESHYLTDPGFCGLGRQVAMLHHVGRSAGISMMDLTQRPSWIPRIIYSSVTHAYIARTRDAEDLKRLSNLGNIDAKAIAAHVASLPSRHDYVYLNPQGDSSPAIVNVRK